MFEEGATESLLALDNSVFFSFSGAPQEQADVRGRRMRIPLKRNAPAQASSAELAGVLVGSKRREIRCVPYSFTGSFNPNLNETFCFSSGFACTDPDKAPPLPPGPGLGDPVKIDQVTFRAMSMIKPTRLKTQLKTTQGLGMIQEGMIQNHRLPRNHQHFRLSKH